MVRARERVSKADSAVFEWLGVRTQACARACATNAVRVPGGVYDLVAESGVILFVSGFSNLIKTAGRTAFILLTAWRISLIIQGEISMTPATMSVVPHRMSIGRRTVMPRPGTARINPIYSPTKRTSTICQLTPQLMVIPTFHQQRPFHKQRPIYRL